MTINLTPDLEKAVLDQARQQHTSPEAVVLDALREKLVRPSHSLPPAFEPRDEWEARLLRLGIDCGVSLSNEAVSSEGIYDDNDRETGDEVIRETRRIKEDLARSMGFDVARIVEDARERQNESGREILPPPPRRQKP
jgi:hypothetical protein